MARSVSTNTMTVVIANFLMITFFYFLISTGPARDCGSSSTASPASSPSRLARSTYAVAPAAAPCPDPAPCVCARPPACPVCATNGARVAPAPPTPLAPACPQCPACPACPAAAPAPRAVAAVPAAKERTAVLAMAQGIKLINAYRFVRSLRQSAPDTDIIVFTDAVSADLQEVYTAFDCIVVMFKPSDLGAKVSQYHPSSYRWIMMDKYLRDLEESARKNGGPMPPYDKLMFSDIRDAVFQGNPFVHVKEPGFYATMEARPRTIMECGWNRGWVKDCFGGSILSQVGGKVISCSGTSLATWDAALQYTKLMNDELLSNSCERNGVDQGMHNVWVHTERVKPMHIWWNEDGPIATVQSMKELHRDHFGRLTNTKGEVYAVVHQYDRSKVLEAQYNSEYTYLQQRDMSIRK